jgi:hypothetical protein
LLIVLAATKPPDAASSAGCFEIYQTLGQVNRSRQTKNAIFGKVFAEMREQLIQINNRVAPCPQAF